MAAARNRGGLFYDQVRSGITAVAARIHTCETDCKSPAFQCLALEIQCYRVAAVSSLFQSTMLRDLTDIMFRATAAAVAVSAIAVLLASSFGF